MNDSVQAPPAGPALSSGLQHPCRCHMTAMAKRISPLGQLHARGLGLNICWPNVVGRVISPTPTCQAVDVGRHGKQELARVCGELTLPDYE